MKDLLMCYILQGREGPLHFIYSHCKSTAEQRAAGQEGAVVLQGVTARTLGGGDIPGTVHRAVLRVLWEYWWHKN